jgi:hypothetical protein
MSLDSRVGALLRTTFLAGFLSLTSGCVYGYAVPFRLETYFIGPQNYSEPKEELWVDSKDPFFGQYTNSTNNAIK